LPPPATGNATARNLEIDTDIRRLTVELAGERTARQADYEQHQDQLTVEQAARQADEAQHRDELAAARAAADKATAELVELAKRLAEIAEAQTSVEPVEAEPEPPRRSAAGRAWRWFLRN
jgi:hypothetical protein